MPIFERARELSVVHSAAAVIGWDQETYLPTAGANHRATQLAWLSARAHEIATSDDWKRDLEAAEHANDGTNPTTNANLRTHVHAHGAALSPANLMEQATGKLQSTEDYITHLNDRYVR